MDKISISPMPQEGEAPYSHIEPIANALLNEGNTILYGNKPFYKDKDGWRCDLTKEINFNLVKSLFRLPNSIELSEEHNSILCTNTWIEIKGNAKR